MNYKTSSNNGNGSSIMTKEIVTDRMNFINGTSNSYITSGTIPIKNLNTFIKQSKRGRKKGGGGESRTSMFKG